MYIDENLIRILETHREETIDVNYAISLVKKIAKEYEQKQLLLHNDIKSVCEHCGSTDFIVQNDKWWCLNCNKQHT